MPREVVATGEFRIVSASASDPRRGDVFGIRSTRMFIEWSLILEHTGDRGRHAGTMVTREGTTLTVDQLIRGDVDNYGRFKRDKTR
ncbi:MAG: hypothetical protein ITG02_01270 [Patulibacter sp.]|nr:hypothetical protein [Patulibacter sp.]